jgi:hypothetical protein
VGAKSRRRGRTPTDRLSWYRQYPARFASDKRIVSDHPSSLTMGIDHQQHRVIIEGKLRYATASGSDNEQVVGIRITLANDHPHSPPTAEDVDSRFPQTADYHKIPGTDQLCIWFRPQARWSMAPNALDVYLSDVTLHVHRQLVYEANPAAGWPGPQHSHGAVAAYLEVLSDTVGTRDIAEALVARWRTGDPMNAYEPCPCGSNQKWRWCHRDVIRAHERLSRGSKLAHVFRYDGSTTTKDPERLN